MKLNTFLILIITLSASVKTYYNSDWAHNMNRSYVYGWGALGGNQRQGGAQRGYGHWGSGDYQNGRDYRGLYFPYGEGRKRGGDNFIFLGNAGYYY